MKKGETFMEHEKRLALALGFFDGVHLGHQALLRRTVERAMERGMRPAVFTFDRSPREFITGEPVPLLTGRAERESLLSSMCPGGTVITAPFDQKMMSMEWENFVEMLVRRFRAGWLVAGHNFRFGCRNAGTPRLLLEKSTRMSLGCAIIPAVTVTGDVVSSTRIRSLLERGDAAGAAALLGRPYALEGPVRPGKGLGIHLGAPTLNIDPPEGRLIPAYGVYLSYVYAGGQRYPALTNVGVRPTVDERGGVTIESHLIERCENRPDVLRVELLRFLRPERRFPSPGDLSRQISRDIAGAKEYFYTLAACKEVRS